MALPTSPTSQFSMTVIVPIDPDRLGGLRDTLKQVDAETIAAMRGQPSTDAPLIPFANVDTIHYARWVIIEGYDRFGTGPLLAFSTNYDGPIGREASESEARALHLDEVVERCADGLDLVYSHCLGYPGQGATPDAIREYLGRAEHQYKSATFYTGSSGRSRGQIIEEASLRDRIEAFLDTQQRTGSLTASSDADAIRRAVLGEVGAQPSFPPQPDNTAKIKSTTWGIVAGVVLALAGLALGLSRLGGPSWPWWLLIVFGTAAAGLGVFLAYLRHLEKTDPQYEVDYSSAERKQIEMASVGENLFLQNQLSHIVDVKVGWVRAFLIRFVFTALQFLARYEYNKGKLGNIPSIHFARWVLVDRGRRLLFFSNFDSSWESYLSDFIDQASGGLTGVWSNTELYPRTRFLLYAGSRAATRFKAWTRHRQIATEVWYCAYPGVSIRNVNDNTVIRRGLAKSSSVSATQWLAKLG